jgi:hypothetical protein
MFFVQLRLGFNGLVDDRGDVEGLFLQRDTTARDARNMPSSSTSGSVRYGASRASAGDT